MYVYKQVHKFEQNSFSHIYKLLIWRVIICKNNYNKWWVQTITSKKLNAPKIEYLVIASQQYEGFER